jgi:hypothetical protein
MPNGELIRDLGGRLWYRGIVDVCRCEDGRIMDILCISHPWPGPRLRGVIVIVYLAVCRLAPGDVPILAVGSILGALLTVEPASSRPAYAGQEHRRLCCVGRSRMA